MRDAAVNSAPRPWSKKILSSTTCLTRPSMMCALPTPATASSIVPFIALRSSSASTPSGSKHEYRVRFPVGIDAPDPGGEAVPQTMRAYGMRGTPTSILIDARGRLRRQVYGVHDDLLLGAELQTLLLEAASIANDCSSAATATDGCHEAGCALPNTG